MFVVARNQSHRLLKAIPGNVTAQMTLSVFVVDQRNHYLVLEVITAQRLIPRNRVLKDIIVVLEVLSLIPAL